MVPGLWPGQCWELGSGRAPTRYKEAEQISLRCPEAAAEGRRGLAAEHVRGSALGSAAGDTEQAEGVGPALYVGCDAGGMGGRQVGPPLLRAGRCGPAQHARRLCGPGPEP